MDRIPALTLWRPWAELVLTVKDVENRDWYTAYRGPLLIHAGKTWDDEAVEFAGAIDECRGFSWREADHPVGIVGLVELTDVCRRSAEHARCWCGSWAVQGSYHWHRENPRGFTQPIPCRGRQGMWYPTGDVADAVGRVLDALGVDDG